VDPNFGAGLVALSIQMPIWIIDTPTNREWAEYVWSRAGSNRKTVTTFRVYDGDAAKWYRGVLPQIELHHGQFSQSPAYDSIEVFGADLTVDLRDAFSSYGFTISSQRTDGFSAVR
jgi:hypothetical protein